MVGTRWMGVVVLAVAGCGGEGPVEFSDDIDELFDFDALVSTEDTLKSPYVVGANVGIHAFAHRSRLSLEGWQIQSADEDVFYVESNLGIPADTDGDGELDRVGSISTLGMALSDGETELLMIDDQGEVRDSAVVEVRIPDRIELYAAGPLFVQHPDLDPRDPDPKVLVDGAATFQVGYFADDQWLAGNGVLEVQAGPALLTEERETWFSEDRDWVTVVPQELGAHELQVAVAGEPIQTVAIEAVGADAVDSVVLYGSAEEDAEQGTWLTVYAQAFDGDDPVYGVAYDWDVDGIVEYGIGDLFRYEYLPETDDDVVAAEFDGLRAEATVHAGESYVDSSNRIGCSSTAVAPMLAPILGALLIRRRRAA